jgi:hypothetical protein
LNEAGIHCPKLVAAAAFCDWKRQKHWNGAISLAMMNFSALSLSQSRQKITMAKVHTSCSSPFIPRNHFSCDAFSHSSTQIAFAGREESIINQFGKMQRGWRNME